MKTPHLLLLGLIGIFVVANIIDRPIEPVETDDLVTIEYWEKWTGFEGEAMKATVDSFNAKKVKNKKGQTIFCRFLSQSKVDQKSLLSIAGGHPPDLAGLWSFNVNVFADMGALMSLDEFVKRDKIDKDKYIPIYWDYCEHNGHVWCMPTTPATVALHWNKDMFKAAGLDPDRGPRTLAELKEYSDKLTKRDENGKVVQMGFLPVEPGWWNWCWGCFYGGKLNEGNKITADEPRNIAGWKWIMTFGDGLDPKRLNAFSQGFQNLFDSPQNAFLSGKVAMELQGVWMANFIRFQNPNLNWGCGPMPSAIDDGSNPVTIAEEDVIVIPRSARHPEEAWELIKYLNSQEGMEMVCEKQGKLTPFKENSPGWIQRQKHPYLQVFIDLAKSKNAVRTPDLPVWSEYLHEEKDAFERVWNRESTPLVTPEQALKDVQQRMQAKLDRELEVFKLHKEDIERALRQ